MLSSGSRLRVEREKPVRIAVFVDASAPDALIDALKRELHPMTGAAMLHIEAVTSGDVLAVDSTADVVIGAAGDSDVLEASLRRAREQFIPTVVVGLGVSRDALSRRVQHPMLDTIADDEPDEVIDALGRWLSDRVSAKRIALAVNFHFVRRAVAEEAIKSTSFQNGVVGAVAFIPGADLPIMTANQAKMVMQIAAAYGEPLGAERIKELAAVVGGALVFRTVARQFVGLIPGFGWAIKASIGYSGTLAVGYAALEYFEAGGDVSGLSERIRQARENALEAARRRRRGEPIPANVTPVDDATPVPVAEQALPEANLGFMAPSTGTQEL